MLLKVFETRPFGEAEGKHVDCLADVRMRCKESQDTRMRPTGTFVRNFRGKILNFYCFPDQGSGNAVE